MLEEAIPPLLDRLAAVRGALDGGPPPPPPPGFLPVPDGPPSRRERALLTHFAWTAYTVLAGRPPASHPPVDFPWRLNAIVPLSQRRADLLPTLARLVDRILTAPAMSALPSPAGLEELLRRSMGVGGADTPAAPRVAPRSRSAPAAEILAADRRAPVALQVDFTPPRPEPVPAVLARLRGLLQPLRACDDGEAGDRRRALFRLAWSGWERLAGAAPYGHDTPYVPRLGDPTPLRPMAAWRQDVPPSLEAVLAQLLDQRMEHPDVRVADVTEWLARVTAPAEAEATSEAAPRPTAPASPAAVAAATAAEAERLLDGFAATGLVRPGVMAARARSIDERAAVAGLAWSVYESLTGTTPYGDGGDGVYAPVRSLAPDAPTALAQLADETLAPHVPGDLPGVAAWLAAALAAEAAVEDDATADATADADRPTAPRSVAARERPRRKVRLLPPPEPATPSWTVVLVAAGALAVVARLMARAP